jgi:hypothetical protein
MDAIRWYGTTFSPSVYQKALISGCNKDRLPCFFFSLPYVSPPGAKIVEDPRGLGDIFFYVVAIHVLCLAAYALYVTVLEKPDTNRLVFRILAFACFPLLPAVQVIRRLFVLVLRRKLLDERSLDWEGNFRGKEGDDFRSPESDDDIIASDDENLKKPTLLNGFHDQKDAVGTFGIGYYLAALVGVCASTGISHPRSKSYLPLASFHPRQLSWGPPSKKTSSKQPPQVLVLAALFLVIVYAIIIYIQRMRITFRKGDYLAVLGFDHRNGWLASGSVAIVILTAITHFQNRKWTVVRLPSPEILSEIAQEDLSNAFLEVAIAGFIQDVLLLVTNRYCTLLLLEALFYTVWESWWAIIFLIAAAAIAFSRRRRIAQFMREQNLTYFLLALCFAPTAFYQLTQDFREIGQIQQDVVFPWNYRWPVHVATSLPFWKF